MINLNEASTLFITDSNLYLGFCQYNANNLITSYINNIISTWPKLKEELKVDLYQDRIHLYKHLTINNPAKVQEHVAMVGLL